MVIVVSVFLLFRRRLDIGAPIISQCYVILMKRMSAGVLYRLVLNTANNQPTSYSLCREARLALCQTFSQWACQRRHSFSVDVPDPSTPCGPPLVDTTFPETFHRLKHRSRNSKVSICTCT